MAASTPARPSRRFLLGAGIALAAGVLATFLILGRDSGEEIPDPPDAWIRDGDDFGELMTAPDGPPVKGWRIVTREMPSIDPAGVSRMDATVCPADRVHPPFLRNLFRRSDGVQWMQEWMQELPVKTLVSTGESTVTAKGTWTRYTYRKWRGVPASGPK